MKRFNYTNKKGKTVRGSAAFNHYVFTDCGGVDAYNAQIAKDVFSEFINSNPDIADAIASVKQRRKIKKIV